MIADIKDAAKRLSDLIKQATAGAEVIISENGVPHARPTSVSATSGARWNVGKYAELWKAAPLDEKSPSSTNLIREERDRGY